MRLDTFLSFVKLTPYLLWCECTWLRKYYKHPERAPMEVRYAKARKLVKRIFKTFKFDIKVNHLEYINNHEGNFVAFSNHRHLFDPLVYIYLSEKPVSFIAKKEAFKMPIVSRVMKSIEAYSIDREDIMSQVHLFKKIAERMQKGDVSYFVFPEGTRLKIKDQVHTLPYKDGSLKLAYWANKDVIFASTWGTHLMFDKKPKGFTKRNVITEFHPPIKISEIIDKPTTEVMPLIEKTTNETLLRLVEENKQRNFKG